MTYRMTDEAMREAIARAVEGFHKCPCGAPGCTLESSPNYLADLNAIREAVCGLPEDVQCRFNERFHAVQFVTNKLAHQLDSADWCQIFCRTVGCGCGCGLTIWECSERKAKEGAK